MFEILMWWWVLLFCVPVSAPLYFVDFEYHARKRRCFANDSKAVAPDFTLLRAQYANTIAMKPINLITLYTGTATGPADAIQIR